VCIIHFAPAPFFVSSVRRGGGGEAGEGGKWVAAVFIYIPVYSSHHSPLHSPEPGREERRKALYIKLIYPRAYVMPMLYSFAYISYDIAHSIWISHSGDKVLVTCIPDLGHTFFGQVKVASLPHAARYRRRTRVSTIYTLYRAVANLVLRVSSFNRLGRVALVCGGGFVPETFSISSGRSVALHW
jgi:hypothetical protein